MRGRPCVRASGLRVTDCSFSSFRQKKKLRQTAKISIFFSLSRATIFILFSLYGGLLVEFRWCLKRRSLQIWALGLSCETPAALGAAGASHDSTRTPNVHISMQRRFKHHQNSTKGNPREGKKENCGRRGKKARNFGPHHPSGPHFSRFKPPPFGAPLFLGLGTLRGLTVRGPTLRRHVGLKRQWPKQVRPEQVNLA